MYFPYFSWRHPLPTCPYTARGFPQLLSFRSSFSVYLSRFYLERYPNGQHEAAARKIILDNEYSKSEGRYRKISTNYCGSTPVLIINNSSYEATFFYDGSFDKGSIRVPKNSRSNINLQNGYYHLS